ncbi:bifunctional serine/threonine-protein kinase/formylglycine-generating enzyme family protein [Alcanivorax sp. S6407]|uniref:bifunctional serine/threonine-protein kinase/formylglycine-generating enzyme family protein n=1 Tax=Alcanivorax sp. S6407 TaxID=2926424 RepID=UPI001FF2C34A|nr:bifunctional serine/threonine-protein kinase/formylglycine-generating enzyme family protein [Alcanivorax sp. S6407]MCK0154914.1 bifunctional serine/threonine-protein kinase/formylglycine-generating enzyme family protein [Alcanivorax sp. S6407]
MDKQTALNALGLTDNASEAEISQAIAAKKQSIAEKQASAPTEALKAKFATVAKKLAEIEAALAAGGDSAGQDKTSSPASSLPQEPSQRLGQQQPSQPNQQPSARAPLSQTKLADLPGMAPQDAAQVELQPGQILANRYEIKELIGQGGMGAVYRAHDKNTDREIALKLLLPSLLKNDSARERFLSEAKISQQLSHPNIVNVFDVQSEGDLFFLTMELLEGQDLRQWLENLNAVNQPTPVDEVKRIASELCDALSYAHEFTVHRDIKPENIWLDEKGRVKLMDFGIARVQSASQRTQTGAAMGTAYYMAPEQLQGRELDARADIYAVGVMLYEMLTGQIPAGRFESAITLRKEIGKGLNNTIDKALAVNPDQRFANAGEMKAALLSGKAGKAPKMPKAPSNPHLSTGPNKLAIAAMVLLLVGGIGVAAQQGWLDALKPLDKDLIAQQKADGTKLLGQIKSLQRRLDDSLRDLDRDVSEAKREGSKRYTTLQTWQDNAEDYITRSSTLTDLLGELAVGEGYLREDATANKAVTTLSEVKAGYEGLLGCFDALEGYETQTAELNKVRQQWQGYGIGGNLAAEVTATETAMGDAKAAGRPCDTVQSTRSAIRGYQALLQQAAPVIAAAASANNAKADWQAYSKKYGFTGAAPKAEQAQQQYSAAQQQSRGGELAASLLLYQSATASWQAAKQTPELVALVKEKEEAAAAAKAKAATVEKAFRAGKTVNFSGVSMKFKGIPGGSFRMGSNDGDDEEKPVHSVRVSSFYMQEHEVTWNQYQPCIDAGVCASENDSGHGKGNRPVINVAWIEAQTYIRWLNKETGQRFRLPSEAEWEYAARAGSTGKYSWGNSISCSQASYGRSRDRECSNNGVGFALVKSFSPNRFGLYDMHGNVEEWVQDCWHDSYNGAPSDGSAWTSGGDCGLRVARSGRYDGKPADVRSAVRDAYYAGLNGSYRMGFRLAQDR